MIRHEKLTTQTARGSEGAFEDLASHIPFGVLYQLLVSPDGKTRRFTFVGRNFADINGVPADAVLADPKVFYSLVAPDHRPRLFEAERRAFDALKVLDIEVEFVKPTGERRWYRLSSAPRRLPDGWILWSGIQRDIHERKNAEEALKQSERRLALALETTQLGLWEYDILNNKLSWDERVKAHYGFPPDAPVNFETYVGGVHPDDRTAVLGAYGDALKKPGGADFIVEHRTVAPNGGIRWIVGHGRVIVDANGVASRVLGTTLDITRRKEAEMHRSLLLNELNHRVKNNFQTVVSILELQRRRAKDPSVQAELANASRRIQSVFQAHQHLYPAAGPVESVDVSTYLQELCRSLSVALFGDAQIEMRCEVDPIELDRDRAVALGLIINELVTNAAKHAFPQGTLGTVNVRLTKIERVLRLIVADNGQGIEDKPSSKGLGSELVRALARQLGGSLSYRAEGGTTVELLLPLAEG